MSKFSFYFSIFSFYDNFSSANSPPHLIKLLLFLLPLKVFQDPVGHHLREVHPHLQKKSHSVQGNSSTSMRDKIRPEVQGLNPHLTVVYQSYHSCEVNHTLMYLICRSSSPIFCFLKRCLEIFSSLHTAQFILFDKNAQLLVGAFYKDMKIHISLQWGALIKRNYVQLFNVSPMMS